MLLVLYMLLSQSKTVLAEALRPLDALDALDTCNLWQPQRIRLSALSSPNLVAKRTS